MSRYEIINEPRLIPDLIVQHLVKVLDEKLELEGSQFIAMDTANNQ